MVAVVAAVAIGCWSRLSWKEREVVEQVAVTGRSLRKCRTAQEKQLRDGRNDVAGRGLLRVVLVVVLPGRAGDGHLAVDRDLDLIGLPCRQPPVLKSIENATVWIVPRLSVAMSVSLKVATVQGGPWHVEIDEMHAAV